MHSAGVKKPMKLEKLDRALIFQVISSFLALLVQKCLFYWHKSTISDATGTRSQAEYVSTRQHMRP
jgi:hypothetical protein